MNSEDLLEDVLIGVFVFSCVTALVNVFMRRISRTDRLVPIFLQISVLAIMLLPMLHGFPNEWFSVLRFTGVWSLCAIAFSLRLYRSPVKSAKLLAVSLFVESIAALFTAAAGYIGSCYIYYGHFVWSP